MQVDVLSVIVRSIRLQIELQFQIHREGWRIQIAREAFCGRIDRRILIRIISRYQYWTLKTMSSYFYPTTFGKHKKEQEERN